MKALLFERRESRYAAALLASKLSPPAAALVGPLSFAEVDEPEIPGPGWTRVKPVLSGICGSDLATLSSATSRYFEPLVSFPFVMGHEVLALTDDGSRVVLDAVLGHAARGETPPFEGAAPADGCDHGHLIGGYLEPGLQIGSCESTGGGWSTSMVAHESQLHIVPDSMSDETAVMIEPAAGAIHAVLRGRVSSGTTVAVLGSGTIGLCAIAALRSFAEPGTVIATAKYPHQRTFASELGADTVTSPGEVRRAVRRITGSRMIGSVLSGGVDVVIDAVGSEESLEDALAITRPRGCVVVCGMPGRVNIDFAPLWHREITLVGAYTYGTEYLNDGTQLHTFSMASDLVQNSDLGRLVTASYPLAQYKRALRHATEAGRRGATKICFDLRE